MSGKEEISWGFGWILNMSSYSCVFASLGAEVIRGCHSLLEKSQEKIESRNNPNRKATHRGTSSSPTAAPAAVLQP